MELLLRREQHTGFLGQTTFVLVVRADFAPDERAHIERYSLGGNVLYCRSELTTRGTGLLGLFSRLVLHARNISVTVNDLARGKRLEFATIEEVEFVELELKAACAHVKSALTSSARYGGIEAMTLG